MFRRLLSLIFCLLTLAAAASADVIYQVTIDTAPLIGHPAGPFALDLQFTDGSGTGDANNTVIVSGFNFDGGNPTGSIFTFGGVTGDLGTSVQMIDSSFFNEFTENFAPGNLLTFQLDLTTNPEPGGTPDEFSLGILDNTGADIPTLDPGGALLVVDIDPGGLNISTFATDTSQSPVAGGNPIDIAAPTVAPQSVPEPSSGLLVATLLVLVWRPRRRAGVAIQIPATRRK